MRVLAYIGLLLLAVVCGIVDAAPVLTFTAEATTGTRTLTPKFTWSTSPAASSCVASGAWSGTKTASGTQTLAAISASKTYNLNCTWPGDITLSLGWEPPTENTDGTPLTDLNGYKLYYSKDKEPPTYDQMKILSNAGLTAYDLTGLTPGKWTVAITALNSKMLESEMSDPVTKDLTAESSQQKSVAITINPTAKKMILKVVEK